jgi:N-carbamoylputrescine amidase
MSSRTLNLALIQQACGVSPAVNLKTMLDAIRTASDQGAQLVILQELHNSLYFCQTEDTRQFDLAETIPGPSTELLGALAAELNIVIVASLFERRAAGLYHNTAVVLDSDGRIAGQYRKMHIPDDPGYYEKFYFTPGDLGFEPINTSLGRLGILVCWDQWYPEAARMMALAGAELLIYPTAIGWDPQDDPAEQQRQRDAWITVQRGHAISNGLPLASCNRTGFESSPDQTAGSDAGIAFWGSSFVAGPQGEMLAQATTDQAEILLASVNLEQSEQVRRIWPFLRDRRIDAYAELLRRYRDQSA